jgi:hypothetical protein
MASSDTGPVTANGDTSKEPPDASSGSRYRFRTDLEIVDTAGTDVTIIDGRTGQQHVFTADEFCLCRAADGNNTLAAIRRAFKAETGSEISHGKVFTFFRRLRSLGLLEESAANKPEPAAPIPGGIKRASGETTGPSAAASARPVQAISEPHSALEGYLAQFSAVVSKGPISAAPRTFSLALRRVRGSGGGMWKPKAQPMKGSRREPPCLTRMPLSASSPL